MISLTQDQQIPFTRGMADFVAGPWSRRMQETALDHALPSICIQPRASVASVVAAAIDMQESQVHLIGVTCYQRILHAFGFGAAKHTLDQTMTVKFTWKR